MMTHHCSIQTLGLTFSLVVVIGLFAACTSTIPVPTPTIAPEMPSTVQEDIAVLVTPTISSTRNLPPTPTIDEEFVKSFGINIIPFSLCTDGRKTTLHFRTDLNAQMWGLEQKDFLPQGKTYLQTLLSLFANGNKFANEWGGRREDPNFNPQTYIFSTEQTVEFPKAAQFGSRYSIKVKVLLTDLPQTYTPIAPLNHSAGAPGSIDVPIEYEIPVDLEVCP